MNEYLNKRFKKYPSHKNEWWWIHEYENFGATYGLLLESVDGVYNLYAYSDSGYSPNVLLTTIKDNINKWAESFCPTNHNFKHDS